jgi:stringent starvation protein B
MTKSAAFVIGITAILLLAFGDWLVTKDFTPYVTAIVTLVSIYLGIQVANNGVKGKTFNKDMWEAEHK